MAANKDSYLSLRQALDSFRDVALAEFDLIEMDDEDDPVKSAKATKEYSQFVLEHVRRFLDDNASRQMSVWVRLSRKLAAKYNDHAASLALHAGKCPPGFREEGGVCVRI